MGELGSPKTCVTGLTGEVCPTLEERSPLEPALLLFLKEAPSLLFFVYSLMTFLENDLIEEKK